MPFPLRPALALAFSVALAGCGPSSTSGPTGVTSLNPSGSGSPGGGPPATGPGAPSSTPSPSSDAGSTPTPGPGAPGADAGTVTPPSDGGVATRKRGLAYGSNSQADLAALSAGAGGIAWWYNWSPAPDGTLPKNYTPPAGVEFVPMVWGGSFDVNKLATQIPAGAKYLLTFNEPNFGSQSNLTPQQAAALWPQIQSFAEAHNLAIVSPALNYCGGNCNATNPFTWLDAFFAACSGCKVDYVAAHWYACSKSALQGYLNEYETKYKQPLWLTEFSCLDGSLAATPANESKYMTEALALLEADPRVFRYSWFTGRFQSQSAIDLLGADGVLTPLGQTYVTLP